MVRNYSVKQEDGRVVVYGSTEQVLGWVGWTRLRTFPMREKAWEWITDVKRRQRALIDGYR